MDPLRRRQVPLFTWVDYIVAATFVIILGLCLVVGVRQCNAQAQCEDTGGTVVKYNCRYVLINKVLTQTCDWRCE